jgi:hypothetical protein
MKEGNLPEEELGGDIVVKAKPGMIGQKEPVPQHPS